MEKTCFEKKLKNFLIRTGRVPFFDYIYMITVVVGQDVSGARRQWGPKLWGWA